MHRAWKIAAGLTVLVLFVFANNTSRVSNPRTGLTDGGRPSGSVAIISGPVTSEPVGVRRHEWFPRHTTSSRTRSDRTRAAFDQGANVVEFDVQRTRDQSVGGLSRSKAGVSDERNRLRG